MVSHRGVAGDHGGIYGGGSRDAASQVKPSAIGTSRYRESETGTGIRARNANVLRSGSRGADHISPVIQGAG